MNAILALTRADLRNIGRDSMLKFLLLYPWLLGLLMRWLVPFAREGLLSTFDLLPYYPLIAGFFGLLMAPALTGTVAGLMMLDERDAGTLVALQVSPFSAGSYIAYRLAGPMLVSAAGIYIILLLMDLVPVDFVGLLPFALLAALESVIFALILASVANNKVQGLALMKGMGLLFLGPLVAWIMPGRWEWLIGFLPTYWPVKAFWLQLAGQSYLVEVVVAVAFHILLVLVFLVRFRRTAYG